MKEKVVFVVMLILSIVYIIVGNKIAMKGDNLLKSIVKSDNIRAEIIEITGETKEYTIDYSSPIEDDNANSINVDENNELTNSENEINSQMQENISIENNNINENAEMPEENVGANNSDNQVNVSVPKYKYNYDEYTIRTFFKARIKTGKHKGQVVSAYQNITPFLGDNSKQVKKGDKVIISDEAVGPKIVFKGEEIAWHMETYSKAPYLFVLVAVFFILIILFGKKKGIKTLISLTFTVLAVFAVFVPAIIGGQNIYAWTIVTCAFITISTILIVYGYSKKTLVTALGCIGGVLVAGLITLFMDGLLNLTGFTDGEVTQLYLKNSAIDLKALIFAGILIGAEGAIMDVAIDIASSLNEVASKMEKPDFSSIIKSGLTIGKDIMGTMTNTLILAYIGSSLATVLLLTMGPKTVTSLFDFELISVEVLQALAGSIGILTTIPLTSVIAAGLYKHKDMSKYVIKYKAKTTK